MKKTAAVFSWSLYDFANSIFAINIISYHFALWVTVEKGGSDLLYSSAITISIIVSGFLMPGLGAWSDRLRKRIPFLAVMTCLCVAFTAAMGYVSSLMLGLAFFCVANVAFQTAGVFYNALLPEISDAKNRGKISGYGVGLGYVGTIIGVIVAKPFLNAGGHQATFVPTAVLFLVGALPCLLFIKEPGTGESQLRLSYTLKDFKNALARIKGVPGGVVLLWCAFLAFNAVSAINVFMSVYAQKIIGLKPDEMHWFIILSTVFAILSALAFGQITDKRGSHFAMRLTLAFWALTMVLAATSFSPGVLWVVGPLAGTCFGAIWVCSRTLIIEMFPEEVIGEVFGIFGLVGRISAIVGPMVWALTTLVFSRINAPEMGYRIAVMTLVGYMCVAAVLFRKIPDSRVKA
ncbi:MAG: MFS transporter [Candidatus Omnitrophica bacterium]|nr:MFS transporter [Candidatus Omnitrophota bacterium]